MIYPQYRKEISLPVLRVFKCDGMSRNWNINSMFDYIDPEPDEVIGRGDDERALVRFCLQKR